MIDTSDWVAHNTFGQHKWKVSYHFDYFKRKCFLLCQWFQKPQTSKWNALCILFLERRFLVTWQARSNREHLICYGISDQTIRRGKKNKKERVNIKSWLFECLQFRVVLRFSFWITSQPLLPENHSVRWDTLKFFSEKSHRLDQNIPWCFQNISKLFIFRRVGKGSLNSQAGDAFRHYSIIEPEDKSEGELLLWQ